MASFFEDVSYVLKAPVATAGKDIAEGSSDQENLTRTIYSTRMRPMTHPQRVLSPIFYAWDQRAKGLCGLPFNVRSQDLQYVYHRRPRCSARGDQNYSRRDCS